MAESYYLGPLDEIKAFSFASAANALAPYVDGAFERERVFKFGISAAVIPPAAFTPMWQFAQADKAHTVSKDIGSWWGILDTEFTSNELTMRYIFRGEHIVTYEIPAGISYGQGMHPSGNKAWIAYGPTLNSGHLGTLIDSGGITFYEVQPDNTVVATVRNFAALAASLGLTGSLATWVNNYEHTHNDGSPVFGVEFNIGTTVIFDFSKGAVRVAYAWATGAAGLVLTIRVRCLVLAIDSKIINQTAGPMPGTFTVLFDDTRDQKWTQSTSPHYIQHDDGSGFDWGWGGIGAPEPAIGPVTPVAEGWISQRDNKVVIYSESRQRTSFGLETRSSMLVNGVSHYDAEFSSGGNGSIQLSSILVDRVAIGLRFLITTSDDDGNWLRFYDDGTIYPVLDMDVTVVFSSYITYDGLYAIIFTDSGVSIWSVATQAVTHTRAGVARGSLTTTMPYPVDFDDKAKFYGIEGGVFNSYIIGGAGTTLTVTPVVLAPASAMVDSVEFNRMSGGGQQMLLYSAIPAHVRTYIEQGNVGVNVS